MLMLCLQVQGLAVQLAALKKRLEGKERIEQNLDTALMVRGGLLSTAVETHCSCKEENTAEPSCPGLLCL